jgi:23S rRNA (cytidine1920-2'-O)/16S rRNA (cytidine1409-2'-O)-methyltransferase
MATARRRLDAELVRRGIVASRREAQELIADDRVQVDGAVANKSARQVSAAESLHVIGPPARFVSRGGEKLEGALSAFDLDVAGLRILDAGASTGGFTDCVLQRGAAHVVALDVGHGQLHERIRSHDQVTVIERFNVRNVTSGDIGGAVDLVVGDLSFISLTVVFPALLSVLRPGGHLVMLVKPQFEAGRSEVSKGRGIVTDPAIHLRVRETIDGALRSLGAEVLGWVDSSITGADGNREFLVHARVSDTTTPNTTTPETTTMEETAR